MARDGSGVEATRRWVLLRGDRAWIRPVGGVRVKVKRSLTCVDDGQPTSGGSQLPSSLPLKRICTDMFWSMQGTTREVPLRDGVKNDHRDVVAVTY